MKTFHDTIVNVCIENADWEQFGNIHKTRKS